ncbi:MAG: hypothetical protein ACO3K7_02515 [Candidatus Marinamargulisbacteria bacterium]
MPLGFDAVRLFLTQSVKCARSGIVSPYTPTPKGKKLLDRPLFQDIGVSDRGEFHTRAKLMAWGDAVALGQKNKVLSLYHSNATLWPTLSNTLCDSVDKRSHYFDGFLPKVTGSVHWNHAKYHRINDHSGCWSGSYTIDLASGPAKARFSYLFVRDGQDWSILHHHSSLMPE